MIGDRLEALYRDFDVGSRLQHDPVAFPRRYTDPRDVEIAGLVAASLAFGRVDLFRPVLARIFAVVDAGGGPRRFVEGFEPERDGAALLPLVYRWNRGVDFVLLFRTLRSVIRESGGLEAPFQFSGDLRASLDRAIGELRRHAVASAAGCGLGARSFDELPRGFRYFLPTPADGSACKRWNMYLRWMVRPTREGVDLGLWKSIPTSALIVPLDTHVARIARFLGLTARTDSSWRTAVEVTEGLRRFDADDPIRFDFAIAHLGISKACLGRYDAGVCPACPLVTVCIHGR